MSWDGREFGYGSADSFVWDVSNGVDMACCQAEVCWRMDVMALVRRSK